MYKCLGQAKGSESYAHSDMEVYDYPGNYKDQEIGERYAKIELEAVQAQDHRRQGSGERPQPVCRRADHTEGPSDQTRRTSEYLIVRAVHSFGDQAYRIGPGRSRAREL